MDVVPLSYWVQEGSVLTHQRMKHAVWRCKSHTESSISRWRLTGTEAQHRAYSTDNNSLSFAREHLPKFWQTRDTWFLNCSDAEAQTAIRVSVTSPRSSNPQHRLVHAAPLLIQWISSGGYQALALLVFQIVLFFPKVSNFHFIAKCLVSNNKLLLTGEIRNAFWETKAPNVVMTEQQNSFCQDLTTGVGRVYRFTTSFSGFGCGCRVLLPGTSAPPYCPFESEKVPAEDGATVRRSPRQFQKPFSWYCNGNLHSCCRKSP